VKERLRGRIELFLKKTKRNNSDFEFGISNCELAIAKEAAWLLRNDTNSDFEIQAAEERLCEFGISDCEWWAAKERPCEFGIRASRCSDEGANLWWASPLPGVAQWRPWEQRQILPVTNSIEQKIG
jgi:hypothetical protein